jgi:predicted enzyme related to lactoylglutathione lyase
VNPVIQTIGVADPGRSAAFWRDILGFEIRRDRGDLEAVSGPACIRLVPRDEAPQTAVMFFEVEDLDAIRQAILTRGGHPSQPARVNRIKIRMFEIRDPDGHTLWFGESFQMPYTPPAEPGMMRKALPQLPFHDVAAAIRHYQEALGFRINYRDEHLGVMDRDAITLLLIERTERHTGIGSAYIYVRDADALHAELTRRGANVLGEPVNWPWGLRDFSVLDCEGNRLHFGQPFE